MNYASLFLSNIIVAVIANHYSYVCAESIENFVNEHVTMEDREVMSFPWVWKLCIPHYLCINCDVLKPFWHYSSVCIEISAKEFSGLS